MSILTLSQIWAIPPLELKKILTAHDQEFTGNVGWDRAVTAQIYHNAGNLDSQDTFWVTRPNFVETMAVSPNLRVGLQSLKMPFITKVIVLSTYFTLVGTGIDARFDIGHEEDYDPMYYDKLLDTHRVATISSLIEEAPQVYATTSTVETEGSDGIWEDERLPSHLDGVSDTKIEAITVLPDASPEATGSKIAVDLWRMAINSDAKIRISCSIPYTVKNFEYEGIMRNMLEVNLLRLVPIARCFWLYSLWELLQEMPPNAELTAQLDAKIRKCRCFEILFDEVPVVIIEGLSPVVGQLGGVGGREGLSTLIGEYVGRPPTREEVLQRLLSLPYIVNYET